MSGRVAGRLSGARVSSVLAHTKKSSLARLVESLSD